MTVSIRSYLVAGVVTAAVSALTIAPTQLPAPTALTSQAVRLSAAVQPLIQPANAASAALGAVVTEDQPGPAAAVTAAASIGQSISDAIINVYNALEPWVEWGFAVAAWAASFVPVVGWFAQQINIAYSVGEPIVGSLVYSVAYLFAGELSLIGPTIVNGLSTAWNNFVTGEINWILGYLPPLPPFPPLAAVAAAAPQAAATVADTASDVQAFATPAEAAPATGNFRAAHSVAHRANQAGAEPAASPAAAASVDDVAPTTEAGPADTDAAPSGVDTPKAVSGGTEATPDAKPNRTSKGSHPGARAQRQAGGNAGKSSRAAH